jgi:predicted phage tail protein
VGGLAPIEAPIKTPIEPSIKSANGAAAASATTGGTPNTLASGIDVAATVTLGASLVLAGAMLLIVRRRPRGRHRMHSVF